MEKRNLTDREIDDILNFITPSSRIPQKTARSLCDKIKSDLVLQLRRITIYPHLISKLKEKLEEQYFSSLIEAGEAVGIITAQSIGEKQTQSRLDSFHKAGSGEKVSNVSTFSDLLNATEEPRVSNYMVYFKYGNDTIADLRKTIGHSLVEITFGKIIKKWEICIEKKDEPWYPAFKVFNDFDEKYTDCISCKIDMDILRTFNIKMSDIAQFVDQEYGDLRIIYSPDNYGQIDIFADTDTITEINECYVTSDNYRELYLEEVVLKNLLGTVIFGIKGVVQMFFLQEDGKWIVELENAQLKSKLSVNRFKEILSHPAVDETRTISSNVWDIYYTFGIQATRAFMIEQFKKTMEGINTCHVKLLVSQMTFTGVVSSISRYAMRHSDNEPFKRASNEETLDNFLAACFYGQNDYVRGVSANIICGSRSNVGTGLMDLKMG